MAGKFGREFRLDEVPVEKEKVSHKERPDSGPGVVHAFCSDREVSGNLVNVSNGNYGHGKGELGER